MPAQLNIKDPETVRLARDLAGSSGRTVTAVIRAALEREQREREARIEELTRAVEEISTRYFASLPPDAKPMTSKELMDALYDEDGDFR